MDQYALHGDTSGCQRSLRPAGFCDYHRYFYDDLLVEGIGRSIGSWAFAGVDEFLDLGYRDSFFVMAGLLIAAALLLTRFNASSHADRVEQLDSDRGSGDPIGRA